MARAKAAEYTRRAAGGVLALLLVVVVAAACDSTSGEGIPGDEGNVLYDTPATVVFEQRVMVGSSFEVSGAARREEDVAAVQSGTFTSSDESILQVEMLEPPAEGVIAARVMLVGPGEAELQVASGGETLDRMRLRAARAGGLDLFDPLLFYEGIDPKLPETFGVVAGQETAFAVGAEDVCGGPLYPVGAVSASLTVADDVPGTFEVEADPASGIVLVEPTIDDGATSYVATLKLAGPGFDEELTREITVYPRSAVDEVEVAVASGDGQTYVTWGRAFVDDFEVVGLEYDWDASPRVSLSVPVGSVNIAEVAQAAEGEPADTRPTFVTAEVFGESDTKDLETVQFATVSRVDEVVPVEDEEPLSGVGSGCGGSTETCDPYAAFAPLLLLLGRRLRRRREGKRRP